MASNSGAFQLRRIFLLGGSKIAHIDEPRRTDRPPVVEGEFIAQNLMLGVPRAESKMNRP